MELGSLQTQPAPGPRAQLFSEKQPIFQATAGTGGRDRLNRDVNCEFRPYCSLWRGWFSKGERTQHNVFMVQLVGHIQIWSHCERRRLQNAL